MMDRAENKRRSLLKRRKRAIIIAVIAVALLAIALAFVLDYVNSITVTDVDGTDYFIRKKDGVYGLYDADDVLLSVDEVYGFYVTAAGSLIKLDPETGEYELFAVVDTEGNETYRVQSRLQMFPHIKKADILSIDVYNSFGSFSFCRMNEKGVLDASADFVLKQSPSTQFNQDLFASLYVSAGYSLTLRKIQDPIVDANGEFSEYGLVSETRINEDGEEYLYEPAYYVLTATDGSKHKVIIGDRVIPYDFTASDGMPVTMGGYYAQYVDLSGATEVKRQSVYVLDEESMSMLVPIENYVTPILSYAMTSTDFNQVEDFTVSHRKEGVKPGDDDLYDPTVSFSYIDMSLREDTMQESFPFVFHTEDMKGYTPSTTTLMQCLQKIYDPAYVKVWKFQPEDEDLVEYGLYGKTTNEEGKDEYHMFAPHTLSYKYVVRNKDNNDIEQKIEHLILLSEKNENGNYYAYTIWQVVSVDADGKETKNTPTTYDMIIEIEGDTLSFMEWDKLSWINKQFIDEDIAFVQDIKIETPDYDVFFDLDNSQSDMTEDKKTTNLAVHGEDSTGATMDTFGRLVVTDKSGYTWYIGSTDLLVYRGSTQMDISKEHGYYGKNQMGHSARCMTEYIECADYKIEVTPDVVRIIYNSGKEESLVRYSTSIFRKFYETLLFTSVVDSYELSEEDREALLNDPDAWLMTITINVDDTMLAGKDGTKRTDVYRFYRLSSRKAYITINGEGGFYVMTSRLEKIVSDAKKCIALQKIDPQTKS